VVGSRWHTHDGVITMLEKCEAIKKHVVEIAGLPTPALRQLMAGARAVLMPSFAEGFGLPVMEALALGTPVIASDIAAHREVGRGLATYFSPIDGLGWRTAIAGLTALPAPGDQASRAAAYPAKTASDYFGEIVAFLEGL
jgi:glycosyltransferase involved in cell wall biosynthesis